MQLLDTSAVGVRREKMYKLDDHVACAVAGITGQRGNVHYKPSMSGMHVKTLHDVFSSSFALCWAFGLRACMATMHCERMTVARQCLGCVSLICTLVVFGVTCMRCRAAAQAGCMRFT